MAPLHLLQFPLHHDDLFRRQPVQPLDDLVGGAMRGGDALDEAFAERAMLTVDIHNRQYECAT